MCGIAGVFHGQASQDVEQMLEMVSHRAVAERLLISKCTNSGFHQF